ncbi:MAG: hypothetical protein ACE14P_11615, partial [Methanotrichaceae archaeon]
MKILLLLLISVAAMISFASAQYGAQDNLYGSSDNPYSSSGSCSADMCKDKISEKCCVVESCDKCNDKYSF